MEIFISYRREDSNTATGRIYDRLVSVFKKGRIFKDVDSIAAGADFREVLKQGVERCDVLLAVIGPEWLGATDGSGKRRLDSEHDFVRIEIESALRRGVPVIPILVEDAAMPAPADLPPTLSDLAFRNYLRVRHDPDFHRDMEGLIEAIGESRKLKRTLPKAVASAVDSKRTSWFRWVVAASLAFACVGLAFVPGWVTEHRRDSQSAKKPTEKAEPSKAGSTVAELDADIKSARETLLMNQSDTSGANLIFKQIARDAEAQREERGRIMQDLQGKIIEITQDVTINKLKAADKAFDAMDGYIRGDDAFPSAGAHVESNNLRVIFKLLDNSFKRKVPDAIRVGLWFGSSVAIDDLDALCDLAILLKHATNVRLTAAAFRGGEQFPGSFPRYEDGAEMIASKDVDVVILMGFLKANDMPKVPDRALEEPAVISLVELAVINCCEAGKDVFVITSLEDLVAWTPEKVLSPDHVEAIKKPVNEAGVYYAAEAALKYRRVVWSGKPRSRDFADFFGCVKSRETSGKDILTSVIRE